MLRTKRSYCLFLIVMIVSLMSTVQAVDHILTFWIRPYPNRSYQPDSFQLNPFITPQALASMIESYDIWRSNGIVTLYGGYIAVSNMAGQVTFPVMQQKPEFLLIVTRHIRPVFMLGNTIHHWELVPSTPAAYFTIQRTQDTQTGLFFWNVQTTQAPEKLIIPLNAIIIFINPEAINVPQGITLTNDQPQLVLPTLYLMPNTDIVSPAMTTLKIKSFFGPIKHKDKKQGENYYATQITTKRESK